MYTGVVIYKAPGKMECSNNGRCNCPKSSILLLYSPAVCAGYDMIADLAKKKAGRIR